MDWRLLHVPPSTAPSGPHTQRNRVLSDPRALAAIHIPSASTRYYSGDSVESSAMAISKIVGSFNLPSLSAVILALYSRPVLKLTCNAAIKPFRALNF